MSANLELAVSSLKQGGVIAYPTEYCFGLGCDPHNRDALNRLLVIKNRSVDQGVILVAATIAQAQQYAHLDGLQRLTEVRESWPGPVTWLLPCADEVPTWIRGKHAKIAIRVSAHPTVQALCSRFGGAIVSTSANRHGQSELFTATEVDEEMGPEVDVIIDQAVGGAKQASQIIDAITGAQLR